MTHKFKAGDLVSWSKSGEEYFLVLILCPKEKGRYSAFYLFDLTTRYSGQLWSFNENAHGGDYFVHCSLNEEEHGKQTL